ncbi:MAG: hypothetical protein ABI806_19465 [Candidatus Solibacter sp.]
MAAPLLLTDLHHLFEDTATAAMAAQRELDHRSVEAAHHYYSIPRVQVAAKFGLSVDHSGLIALLLGSGHKEQFTHTLQFALTAIPNPAPAALPPDLTPSVTLITEPTWMVDPLSRRHLGDVLALALRAGRCRFAQPAAPTGDDLAREAEEIEATIVNTKDDSIGYLVVRLGDGGIFGGHDGVFLLEPGADLQVTVFDFLTSDQDWTSWSPFAQWLGVWTQWLAAGRPGNPVNSATIPGSFGSIAFLDLAQGLWQAYAAARRTLSGTEPSYRIQNVGTELSFAIPPSGGGDDDTPYISSRVSLQIQQAAGQERLAVRLVAPEYLLVDDARAAFGQQLAAATQAVLAETADPERDAIAAALSDRNRRDAALVMLSYRGGHPKNEFLVVHPAAWNGAEAQFAFTCRIGKHGIESVKLRKHLAENAVSNDEYVGIHNHLHAIRIWEMAGHWTVRS